MSSGVRSRRLRLPRSPVTIVTGGLALATVVAAIVVVGPEAAAESEGRVVTARRGVIQSTVSASGNLQPANQVSLDFATAGRVEKIYVKAGQHVTAGSLIARISDASQRVAVAQAEASLEVAEAGLDDAKAASSSSDDASTASAPVPATTTASAGAATSPGLVNAVTATASPAGGAVMRTVAAITTAAAPATTEAPAAGDDGGTTTDGSGSGAAPSTSTAPTRTTTTPASGTGSDAGTGTANGKATTGSSGPAGSAAASGTGAASGSGAATSGGGTAGESAATARSSAASGSDSGSASGGANGGSGGSATSVASAEASVAAAKLAVTNAEQDLEGTRLRAPVSGTITDLGGAVGDSVSGTGNSSSGAKASTADAGTGQGASSGSGASSTGASTSTGFATLMQLSRLDLEVSFSESDIGDLQVGQAATVTVTALDGTKLAAKVTAIGTTATSSSGVVSYPVTLAVTQSAAGIRPGMSASAEVVIDQAKGISVPSQALAGRTMTVRKGGKDVPIAVTTGVVGDSTTQVLSGIEAGDQVVLPALATSTSGGAAAGQAGGSGGTGRLGGGAAGGIGGGSGRSGGFPGGGMAAGGPPGMAGGVR